MPPPAGDARQVIARHRWWHTIDLGDGIVTPGAWDIRHLPARIPWPGSLAGARCLDVGTFDGFWAFEMERRGACEVLAIDVERPAAGDVPHHLRDSRPRGSRRPGETFTALAGLLGSRAQFREMNLHDLRPEEVGLFDLVFVGYMLHQLRDPVGALETVLGVCRGSVIVLDQVLAWRSLTSCEPLARFGARRGFSEWYYFNAAGLCRVVELAGFHVAAESPFLFYRRGPGVRLADLPLSTILKYTLGRAACSLAVRGEVEPRQT